jgi:hypothetical protein
LQVFSRSGFHVKEQLISGCKAVDIFTSAFYRASVDTAYKFFPAQKAAKTCTEEKFHVVDLDKVINLF